MSGTRAYSLPVSLSIMGDTGAFFFLFLGGGGQLKYRMRDINSRLPAVDNRSSVVLVKG